MYYATTSLRTPTSQRARRQKNKKWHSDKEHENYTEYRGKGHTNPHNKGTGKGNCQSRPYHAKGQGKNPYHNTGSYGSYNNTYRRQSPR
eukprot:4871454-Amphidinium_carterae.1